MEIEKLNMELPGKEGDFEFEEILNISGEWNACPTLASCYKYVKEIPKLGHSYRYFLVAHKAGDVVIFRNKK